MTLKEYLHSLSPDARSRLADRLDTSDGYLKKLMYVPSSRVSPDMALKIEIVTGGAITRAEILPELYVGMVSIATATGGGAFSTIAVPCRFGRADADGTFDSSDDVTVNVNCGARLVLVDLPGGSSLVFSAENALFLASALTRCSAADLVLGSRASVDKPELRSAV